MIYNHMVIDSRQLDRVFGALSDPTRRGILAGLAQGEATVSDLAQPFEMSQPAISKHLRVLEGAGLIERIKQGRQTRVRAKPEATRQAVNWITHYVPFWTRHFDAVEQILNDTSGHEHDN